MYPHGIVLRLRAQATVGTTIGVKVNLFFFSSCCFPLFSCRAVFAFLRFTKFISGSHSRIIPPLLLLAVCASLKTPPPLATGSCVAHVHQVLLSFTAKLLPILFKNKLPGLSCPTVFHPFVETHKSRPHTYHATFIYCCARCELSIVEDTSPTRRRIMCGR